MTMKTLGIVAAAILWYFGIGFLLANEFAHRITAGKKEMDPLATISVTRSLLYKWPCVLFEAGSMWLTLRILRHYVEKEQ